MKKYILIILSLLMVVSYCSVANADEFILRGVKFGITLDEVKAIETLEYSHKEAEKETYYYKGTLSGIENSTIGYKFENGSLKSILIDFDNTRGNLLLKRDYDTINSALTTKYGKPLGFTGGKTYEFVGNNLNALSATFPLASLVNMSYEYSEWWIETDGGHVKIDQMFTFIPGKKGVAESGVNSLQYTFFSDADVNKVMGDL